MNVQAIELAINVDVDDVVSSYGGESWENDHHFVDYGLSIGGISISGLSIQQMKKLGENIVNTLLLNGHVAELPKLDESSFTRKLKFNE